MKPLDIETMPMIGLDMPEPEAPKNYKDPEKIDKYKELAREKQAKTAALDPLYGMVCAVCVGNECRVLGDVGVETERDLLEWAHGAIYRAKSVCTWNGTAFDVPYIYKRSIINALFPKLPMLDFLRPHNNIHVDLSRCWDFRGYTSLDAVAKAVLGEQKHEIDHASFPDLVKTDHGRDTVRSYCLQDAKLTGQICERFSGVLF